MRRPTVGLQDDTALLGDPAKRDALLSAMARGGAKVVRTNIMYGATKGGRDLAAVAALVDAARARGMTVRPTLMPDPSYVTAKGALNYANADPKLMAQFARNVAIGLKGRVDTFSVGNEPNYPTFMKGADTDPRNAGRRYRQEFRAAQGAIQGVDKNTRVLLGELTPGGGGSREFLKGLLSGKPITASGFAYHPYQYDQDASRWDIHRLAGLQATLARYQRQGKLQTRAGKALPLYLTEFGYQRGEGRTDAVIRQENMNAYRLAEKAGAREMDFYQVTPTPRAPGAPGTPDVVRYDGGVSAGQPGRAPDTAWKWDTSVSPTGAPSDVERFVRMLTRGARR